MYKIVFLLVNAIYLVSAARLSNVILGGDRDEHNCIQSAGYKWCEEDQACVSINQICGLPTV